MAYSENCHPDMCVETPGCYGTDGVTEDPLAVGDFYQLRHDTHICAVRYVRQEFWKTSRSALHLLRSIPKCFSRSSVPMDEVNMGHGVCTCDITKAECETLIAEGKAMAW